MHRLLVQSVLAHLTRMLETRKFHGSVYVSFVSIIVLHADLSSATSVPFPGWDAIGCLALPLTSHANGVISRVSTATGIHYDIAASMLARWLPCALQATPHVCVALDIRTAIRMVLNLRLLPPPNLRLRLHPNLCLLLLPNLRLLAQLNLQPRPLLSR